MHHDFIIISNMAQIALSTSPKLMHTTIMFETYVPFVGRHVPFVLLLNLYYRPVEIGDMPGKSARGLYKVRGNLHLIAKIKVEMPFYVYCASAQDGFAKNVSNPAMSTLKRLFALSASVRFSQS